MKSLLTGLFCLVLGFQQTIRAQDYSFKTVAGFGRSSVDGTNNASRFRFPQSVVMDEAGDLYVADGGNAAIRRLHREGSNWITTTILGITNNFGAPIGTPDAQFSFVRGLAFGPDKTLYFGDVSRLRAASYNSTNWTAQTLVGTDINAGPIDGTNNSASFGSITGLAMGSNGILFTADAFTIREIVVHGSDTIVKTIFYTTNDSSLFGIAIGTNGDLYVTSPTDHTVDRLYRDGTNWNRESIAGLAGVPGTADGPGSAARFDSPEGIAVDDRGNLFVADRVAATIREISPNGTNWTVKTIAGSAELAGFVDGNSDTARFFGPTGILVDKTGLIFVADAINDAIREIVPDGTNWLVQTIAGNRANAESSNDTSGRFFLPQGVAVDFTGNVFVADTANFTIKQLVRKGTNWTSRTIAGIPGVSGTNDGLGWEAHLAGTVAVAAGRDHSLYAADSKGKIRELVEVGTDWTVSTIIDLPSVLRGSDDILLSDDAFQPSGIAADRVGNVYVSIRTLGKVYKFSETDGMWSSSVIANFGTFQHPNGDSSQYSSPQGITATPDGEIVFVTDQVGIIWSVSHDATGTNWVSQSIAGAFQQYVDTDGPGSNARFESPAGIAVDRDGNLYVVGYNTTVRKIEPNGTNWMVRTIGGVANDHVSVDGIGSVARLTGSTSIAVDSMGTLYIPDVSNCTIWMGQPIFPSLSIELSGASPIVSWPSWAVDFSLEGIDALGGTNAWSAAGQPNLVGDQYVRTNKPADSQHFFRLRQN